MRKALIIALLLLGGVVMGGEKKVEVKTYIIHYYCDKEGCDGELLPTGTALTSSPLQYPHKCTKCDYSKAFSGKTYPYAVHETIAP